MPVTVTVIVSERAKRKVDVWPSSVGLFLQPSSLRINVLETFRCQSGPKESIS